MGFFSKAKHDTATRADTAGVIPPPEDEAGLVRVVDWTKDEERKAKRKRVHPQDKDSGKQD